MLYILEDSDKLGADFLTEAIPHLSLQRIRRLDELRIEGDKINCAAAYLMLRYALRKEYGINDNIGFTFTGHGKPYPDGYPDIYFNLSHCRNSCACIVSDRETAVDIADIRRVSLRTAGYFCSDEELERLSCEPENNAELIRLWSRKECLSKLDGKGLLTDFKKLTGDTLKNIHTFRGRNYYCSYYSTKDKTDPVFISTDEIFTTLNT